MFSQHFTLRNLVQDLLPRVGTQHSSKRGLELSQDSLTLIILTRKLKGDLSVQRVSVILYYMFLEYRTRLCEIFDLDSITIAQLGDCQN